MFTENTLGLMIALLSAILSLYAFVLILWGLSASFKYNVLGFDLESIPGYLVYAALFVAVFGTVCAHLIGRSSSASTSCASATRRLPYSLVRVAENDEQIASEGRAGRGPGPVRRFANVVANWFDYMKYTKRLTWFTSFVNQASIIFPFILLAARLLLGAVQLGSLTQTAALSAGWSRR